MNYLAHLSLAQHSAPSKVGNLLGDFMHGVETAGLSLPVRQGLENHRLVDRFTDSHEWVMAQRRQFSPARRRFAGVTLDVLFDHFLWHHWDRFYTLPRATVIEQHYLHLQAGEELMPDPMRLRMGRVVEHDLLNRYVSLQQVGQALDMIAGRIRFPNDFAGIVEEMTPRYDALEEGFLGFYPALQEAVQQASLELPQGRVM